MSRIQRLALISAAFLAATAPFASAAMAAPGDPTPTTNVVCTGNGAWAMKIHSSASPTNPYKFRELLTGMTGAITSPDLQLNFPSSYTQVRVMVSDGGTVGLVSAASRPAGCVPPAPKHSKLVAHGVPAISGAANVGRTVTAVKPSLTLDGHGLTTKQQLSLNVQYVWKANGTQVGTGRQFKIASSLRSKDLTLTVYVRATDSNTVILSSHAVRVH